MGAGLTHESGIIRSEEAPSTPPVIAAVHSESGGAPLPSGSASTSVDTMDLTALAATHGIDASYFAASGFVLDDDGRLVAPDDPFDSADDDLGLLLHSLATDLPDHDDDDADAVPSTDSMLGSRLGTGNGAPAHHLRYLHALRSAELPCHLDEAELLQHCTDSMDPGSRALHALDVKLKTTGEDRSAFYRRLRVEEPLLHPNAADVIGHMDGGAQASTTDDLDALWYVQPLSTSEQRVRLNVADKTPHFPTSVGFLKVPTHTASGSQFVRCFYTPSLPVTIISPNAMGMAARCGGYSTYSNFLHTGTTSQLRLHHCRRHDEDIVIPLQRVRGLLFTEPLIRPTTGDDMIGPRPRESLHVRLLNATPDLNTGSTPADATQPPCGCCSDPTIATEPSEATADALADALLHYQRLGYQSDHSIGSLGTASTTGTPYCSACSSASAPSKTAAAPCETRPITEEVSSCSTTASVASLLLAPKDGPTYTLNHVTRDQLRLLWHQRLGHMHFARVHGAHQYATGVPQVPLATELDGCPVCDKAKLHKAARSKDDSRRATRCGQGISIDFGFIVQASEKNPERMERLQGLDGQVCYCLIADHFSGTLYGETFRSKAPPIEFVNRWLARHGLPHDVPDKYVRFDLGGELGRSPDIVGLFEKAGYSVEPTAPNTSSAIGNVERPHRTIADGIRSMLGGANLPPKFWPYCFSHFLRLYNVTVHGDRTASPYEICTGKKPDLRLLRVWGCRLYALPPRARRPSKIESDTRVGIFLGFCKTMKHAIYYDVETEVVKTAGHVRFDESMHDLDDKPPNARILASFRSGKSDDLDCSVNFPEFEVYHQPFTSLETITVPLDFSSPDKGPLGISFADCPKMHRCFVTAFSRTVYANKTRGLQRKYVGSYVVSVNDEPVFHLSDLQPLCPKLYMTI